MKQRLIAVVVLSAVFVALLVLFFQARTVAVWVGHADVPLDFVFLDSGSGQPIAGASLNLRDPDYLEGPPKEPHSMVGTSGPDGHARLTVNLLVYGSDRMTVDGRFSRNLSRRVEYPNWECRVSAEAYQNLTLSDQDFQSQFTGDRRFHADKVPPPIVLRLRRQDRPNPVP